MMASGPVPMRAGEAPPLDARRRRVQPRRREVGSGIWRRDIMTIRTLGLIGSGMIGSALARLAVTAGLDVVLSNSRGPESLSELVAELGEQARAATPAG